MKRKSVKQHLDLFEQDKEPVRVPPGLRKEMLHLVEMLLIGDHGGDGDKEQGDR